MVGIVWPSWVGVDVMGRVGSLVGMGWVGSLFGCMDLKNPDVCSIYNECLKVVPHNNYNHTFQ